MDISSVCSFQMWSGGSLIIIFKLLRCRNSALSRVSFSLEVGMFLHLGGFHTPPMFICPLNFWMPPYIQTPPYVPNAPQCICIFIGVSACDRGCMGPSIYLDTFICLDASPYVKHPPHICLLHCTSVCSRGICM